MTLIFQRILSNLSQYIQHDRIVPYIFLKPSLRFLKYNLTICRETIFKIVWRLRAAGQCSRESLEKLTHLSNIPWHRETLFRSLFIRLWSRAHLCISLNSTRPNSYTPDRFKNVFILQLPFSFFESCLKNDLRLQIRFCLSGNYILLLLLTVFIMLNFLLCSMIRTPCKIWNFYFWNHMRREKAKQIKQYQDY